MNQALYAHIKEKGKKNTQHRKRAGRVMHVVEHLHSRYEALSSNSSTVTTKEKTTSQ
jgi:hypothetical protein